MTSASTSVLSHRKAVEVTGGQLLAENISLRKATPADGLLCESLFIESHQEPLQLAGWDQAQCRTYLLPQFSMRDQDILQKYPQAYHSIILADGIEVGQMIINRQPNEFHIVDIALLNHWRRRGIGSYLLTGLCTEADQKQKIMSLHVAYDNSAMNLYQSFGFETIDDQDVYRYMERQPQRAAENTLFKGGNYDKSTNNS